MKKQLHQLIHSLMIQLIFHHLKKNLALLGILGIVIAAFSGGLGKVYGIHYLFVDPEYLGKVNFFSFFFVGLSLGNLMIAWHITTYILDGHRFRFIGAVERPFTTFSVNNSLIPLLITLCYLGFIIHFQLSSGLSSASDILLFCFGLIAGIIAMHLIMILYFRFTNKDIFIFIAGSLDKKLRKNKLSRSRMMRKFREFKADSYEVTNYINLGLHIRSVETVEKADNKEAIVKVFDQNHFNSVIFELIIILFILLLGFFMHVEFLQIPAAASAVLILTIAVMLVGAISYWFRGWGVAFAFGIFILLNLGVKLGITKGLNQATGLDYYTQKANYSIPHLQKIHSKEQYVHDYIHMQETLENWKAKFENPEKEKMVFLCVSGGGQRAAVWVVNALLQTDKELDGNLMNQTALITGASGGMIGAAYYREAYLQDPDIALSKESDQLLDNIAKDNLNPVIFSLLVNDLLLKIQTHDYAGRSYITDRGYTFERNLNKNLGGTLDKKISDYRAHEENAHIPTLVMSPTIANDGRKLYISAQPVSFLAISSQVLEAPGQKIRGADFQSLFRHNASKDLSFLTALRMSASFPYITPNISLPTEPRIEIMDAGISDNFGVSDALRFINVFKGWIEKNTAGVVLIVVRDTKSDSPIEEAPTPSVIDRLTYPIASVYNNLTHIQDVQNDVRTELMKNWLSTKLDVVEIAYDSYHSTTQNDQNKSEAERASLSWHLTSREKRNIIGNIQTESNQEAIRKIKELLTGTE